MPRTVIDPTPDAARFEACACEIVGASNVKIPAAVPIALPTVRPCAIEAHLFEAMPPELRNWTVVALVHDVVPMATSARKAVGVRLYCPPKLRPEMVMEVPPVVALFGLPRTLLAAGASKVNRVLRVPTTAETVSTTLPGCLPAAFFLSTYELDEQVMVEADDHAVVAHASKSS
jgi:hypothetical protein